MKTVEHIDLVSEARNRVTEIHKLLENCLPSQYVALYINEHSGYTLSTIQKGWETRTPTISFGTSPKSIETINEIINDYNNFEC